MNNSEPRFYEFGPYRLDLRERCLLLDGKSIRLTPKLFNLLFFFVQSGGRLATKDELMKAGWPEKAYVEEAALSKNISRLKKALANGQDNEQFIETLTGHGYRFLPDVRAVEEERPDPATESADINQVEDLDDSASLFGGNHWHALAACLMYAALYGVALLVEVAYQFDIYARAGIRVAAALFLWAFLASLFALAVDRKLIARGSAHALSLSGLTLLVSAAILFVGACLFLPSTPITEAALQTQTAQAAYLKTICYFITLALLFLITPFHFVLVLERELREGRREDVMKLLAGDPSSATPKGAVFIRPRGLASVLVAMMAVALFLHFKLMDNLSISPFTNLFSILIYIRLFLYFILAMECLFWYSRAINEIKRQCLIAHTISERENPQRKIEKNFQTNRLRKLIFFIISPALLIFVITTFIFLPDTSPGIRQISILTPPAAGREFKVRINAAGIDPDTVQIVVIGPGCPRTGNCVVPNNVLRGVSSTAIEEVPLKLAEGNFEIYLRNGEAGKLSNGWTLTVGVRSLNEMN